MPAARSMRGGMARNVPASARCSGSGSFSGHNAELRRRLVVPGAPGPAAIQGHNRPLVAGDNHAQRVFRRNPNTVIVVAAGGAFEGGKTLAAIGGLVHRCVGHENDLGIFWVHGDSAEIPSSSPYALFAI